MLSPKPTGGDRPLGLIPMFVRVWEQLSKPPVALLGRAACWLVGCCGQGVICAPSRPTPRLPSGGC
eukprot:461865-Alexandrium_andersonii.AAC.1